MKIVLSVADMSVGGIATFVLNLSQILCRVGHAVTVIAPVHGAWWPRLAEIGVTGLYVPPRTWDSVRQQTKCFAACVTKENFDLLAVNIGINNRLPMLALHKLPDALPIVLILHNDRPEVYQLAAVNQPAWNCAVGVSPKVQRAASMRLPQKNIQQIPYGIALPAVGQLAQRAEWSTPLRLLFVGRLDDHQKGIFRLPAILATCRDQGIAVHLTVIGDGPDREPLARLCRAAGVADLVDLVGFLVSEAVFAQMRSHHLLLLPSNFEGVGMVIQEAQANGCVPIATRLLGVTDTIIADGVDGKLVEPMDIRGFVAAIRSFLTAAEWQRCSRAGSDHAQRHYSIRSMADRYTVLFGELCQGAHPLPVARSVLRRQGITPLRRRDALPGPLRTRLQKLLRKLPCPR